MSDAELIQRLKEAVGDERRTVRVFLELLIEFKKRRLHQETSYGSLFNFCRRELGLAEGDAYRRIRTVEAAQNFPIILDMVESGELHLSAIAVLTPHLNQTNFRWLLERAKAMSKHELEYFVASLSSAVPARPDVIRPLPPLRPAAAIEESPLFPVCEPPAGGKPLLPAQPSPRSARVEFTADEELLAGIDRARALLSHKIPDGSLCSVFKEAVAALLGKRDPDETLGRAQSPTILPGRRRVPKAIRRAVWRRDGGCCAFVAADGRRCVERRWLEYDHILPFACGGRSDDSSNIRLLCRAHNQREARRIFGDADRFDMMGRVDSDFH